MALTVGITCDFVTHKNRRGMDIERHAATYELCQRIAQAGARPVLLPHLTIEQQHLINLATLDGLIISGGDFDVPPALFGEAPHPRLGRCVPARTSSEWRLLELAYDQKLPTLGLCGGMQLINVFCGGSLVQDVSLIEGALCHEQPHDTRLPAHSVELKGGSRAAAWLGTRRCEVNSTHHQVVGRLGEGVVASGWARDGVIEAIELVSEKPVWLGVQWHPEMLSAPEHVQVFSAFVTACRAAKL